MAIVCSQSRLQSDYNGMKQSLDEERYRSERLEEQINDLTELHQHEVTNLKQVSRGHGLQTGHRLGTSKQVSRSHQSQTGQ